MWWILFQKVELKWCWLTITYTTWDNRNNLWLCCSLSSSEDDVEEHAKDSKDNARGGQDGVADEEGLVDFSKHLYWCAIGGDTTLRDFTGKIEGEECACSGHDFWFTRVEVRTTAPLGTIYMMQTTGSMQEEVWYNRIYLNQLKNTITYL